MERLEGRRPVLEALRAGRTVRRVVIAEGARSTGVLADILSEARARGVRIDRVPRAALERRAQTRGHQGILAEVEGFRPRDWREGVAAARAAARVPLVLAMDGITDPGNVGSLLRSAGAFGVDAVLMPSRRAAGVTPAAAKAAAGAVEHLVIDRVSNLERALDACRRDGLWIVCGDAGGEVDVRSCELLSEPVAVVVGGEGSGVSRLVRERSDVVCRVPLAGPIASLNAGVAGAILLWEAARRRASSRGFLPAR
jgi:23S rRNA (guanosine2251-2'-O)-methyltransferase